MAIQVGASPLNAERRTPSNSFFAPVVRSTRASLFCAGAEPLSAPAGAPPRPAPPRPPRAPRPPAFGDDGGGYMVKASQRESLLIDSDAPAPSPPAPPRPAALGSCPIG